MRPSLILLAFTLAAGAEATSSAAGGANTLLSSNTPNANSSQGLWQRWFGLPTSNATNNPSAAARRVRSHGPRRRSVHP
ncbi:hypothetical protein K438DRAFT_1805117 [Mycena galopus ATCC 62051]|nr:hypothetical protein K438DRAFT_1805117 [Mycena galopus ATCC 62051]